MPTEQIERSNYRHDVERRKHEQVGDQNQMLPTREGLLRG